jgi:hypothetical protein
LLARPERPAQPVEHLEEALEVMSFEEPVARCTQRNAGLLAVPDHIIGLEAALYVDVHFGFRQSDEIGQWRLPCSPTPSNHETANPHFKK